mmetsp:Transcript_30832/g.72033  ORF Transcript_30832/g.72033 Transcript_30832/m.72033 type:complete len:119 (+) Transcript_30832:202-558(+)
MGLRCCSCFRQRDGYTSSLAGPRTLGHSAIEGEAFTLNIQSSESGASLQLADVHSSDTLEMLKAKVIDALGEEVGAIRRESSSEMRVFQVTEYDMTLDQLGVKPGSRVTYLPKPSALG